MSSAPLEVRVDSGDLAKLFADAKAAPGMFQVELRRGIKRAAKPIEDGIKAAAPSARIAGAVKTTASFARNSATVKIVVDRKIAPHAAPINNNDHSGVFRHPVFADASHPRSSVYRARLFHKAEVVEQGWTWVGQTARPFFLSGARSGEAEADRQMLQVMDDVARKLGFK